MKTIGELIRIHRINKGYSQDYLGNILNITQQSYSRIEKNPEKTSLESILKIAKVLEINMADIQNIFYNV